MRVLFIGSQRLGLRCLEVLHSQGDEIVGVITATPDTHELWKDEVMEFVKDKCIPFELPKNINSQEIVGWIKERNPEIIYVIGWRQMISREILDIPEFGTVGIHFSLLPKFRGHAPVSWAIISGEKETGLTLFYFSERADAGDIIAQKSTYISIDDDANTLRARLIELAIRTVKEYAPLLRDNRVIRKTQDETQASYGGYRLPEHGKIDWSKSTREIYDLIRATTKPYPGAFTWYKKRKVIVWTSELLISRPGYYGIPGQILLWKKNGIIVKTGDRALLVKDIQIDMDAQLATDIFKNTKERFK